MIIFCTILFKVVIFKLFMDTSYCEIAPPKHLEHVVKNFWTIEYEESAPKKDYLLPSTLCYLFFMRTPKAFDAHFVTSQSHFEISNGFHLGHLNSLVEFTHHEMYVVGVSIYPIYLKFLFKSDYKSLMNQVHKMTEIPSEGLDDKSIHEVVKYIENEIKRRLEENPIKEEFELIYKKMIEEKLYRSSVEEIANWVGYSSRHLANIFRKHLGISTKKFIQLMRFNHALKLMEEYDRDINFSQIGHELGYHDQSHFIKDFRNVCGRTPMELAVDKDSMSKYFKLF